MPARRRALGLTCLVALAAFACDNKPAPTEPTHATSHRSTPRPKPSASPAQASPTPGEGGLDTPRASASPGPSAAPSPDPSPSPSPSPSPLVAVSAPPIPFPFTKAGTSFNYNLTVKLSLGAASGTASIAVKAVTAADATLATSFTIANAPVKLPGQGTPSTFNTTMKNDVTNPYALGNLFPKAGTTVVDTVTATAKESITVAAGSFDTNKYTINEQTGADTATVTLWLAADGTMVKQQIDGNKPPALVDLSSLGPMASMLAGKTTTTLELASTGSADGTASGASSPDPNASGAASPDPNASAAQIPVCPPSASPDVGTPALGQYGGQHLPPGWVAKATSEAAVTALIDPIAAVPADWACFQQVYPGASVVYKRIKGL